MRLYPSSQMRKRRRAYADDRERAPGSPLARAEAAERSDDVSPVAGEVLRFQRSGGNGAVNGLIARQESPLARDGGDDESKKPATFTLLLPEPVSVMPVISWGRGGNGREMRVIVPSTASDPTLFRWMASSKALGKVTISGRVTVTIDDAIISSCQQSGSSVELTLDGQASVG